MNRKRYAQSQIRLQNETEMAHPSQTIGYLIYLIATILETLLIFRLILKLTGANPESGFVSFVYDMSANIIAPFSGIFRTATTQGVETTAMLEPANLVAIVVYGAGAWILAQLVAILSGRSQESSN